MDDKIDRTRISMYYDTFCEEEKFFKLNIRHYEIFRRLIHAGLKKHHNVLEVGCGFGTVTVLLAKYLKTGTILATDISEGRINSCISQFKRFTNTRFLLSDMRDFLSESRFDFIILPDVLEHIPIENHDTLFKNLSNHLAPNGTIFIHIPHPYAIAHLQSHNPSLLQIIDQEIHADSLFHVAYKHGLIAENLQSYRLSHRELDYQAIVLRKREYSQTFTRIPKLTTIIRKFFARVYFNIKSL